MEKQYFRMPGAQFAAGQAGHINQASVNGLAREPSPFDRLGMALELLGSARGSVGDLADRLAGGAPKDVGGAALHNGNGGLFDAINHAAITVDAMAKAIMDDVNRINDWL